MDTRLSVNDEFDFPRGRKIKPSKRLPVRDDYFPKRRAVPITPQYIPWGDPEEDIKPIKWRGTRDWYDVDDGINCAHRNCSQCHGSGTKRNGEKCIHMLVCSCPLCNNFTL